MGDPDDAFGALSDIPELSIVVVSYGAAEMTLQCLRSIVSETHATPHEVLIVDNGSGDATTDAIAKEFPTLSLFRLDQNEGFGAACNVAANAAKGRYLLFLNPDTVILDRAIDRLQEFARRRPQALIWGGRTLFGDGSLNPTSCWRRQSLWGLFCAATRLSRIFPLVPLFRWQSYGDWKRDSEREVDIVTGCFLLITRELWDRLGGFAPEFFMYGEDADLCLRARRHHNARPAITPSATIIHYGSGTESNKARKIAQVLAASALLIRKHFRGPARPIGITLLALRPFLAALLARGALRNMWAEVWASRHQWLAGRYDPSAE